MEEEDDSSSSVEILMRRPEKPLPSTPQSPLEKSQSSVAVASPTLSPGRTWRPSRGSDLAIGARRAGATEKPASSEESNSNSNNSNNSSSSEVETLKALVRKLQQQHERDKRAKEKVALRFRALVDAGATEARAVASSACKETCRAHDMSITLFQQWLASAKAAEAREAQLRMLLERSLAECEYLRSRTKQTEELAKAVVVFVRGDALPQQQERLTQAIKAVREANPVSARPENPLGEASAQQLLAECEAAAAKASDEDVAARCERFAALQARAADFERFVRLKKEQLERQEASLLAESKAGDELFGETVIDEAAVAPGEGAALTSSGSRSSSVPSARASVSNTTTTTSMASGAFDGPPALPPRPSHLIGASAAQRALVRDQKTPKDFPLYDAVSVRYIRKVLNLLGQSRQKRTSTVVPRTRSDSTSMDPVREAANREVPDVEFIVSELLASHKRTPRKNDPLWRNNAGKTLLHVLAEREGTGKAITLLIKKEGFDPCTLDSNGFNAMHLACIRGSSEAVDAIARSGPPHVVDSPCHGDISPLHIAAVCGHVNSCKLLVERGAKGDVCDANGCTPLMYSVLNDKPSVTRFFMDKQLGVNVCDFEKNSPLLFAAGLASSTFVSSMVAHGANPNAENGRGLTPLWIALQSNDLEMVHVILDTPAVSDFCRLNFDLGLGRYRNPLLHWIAAFLHDSMASSFVELLIRKGASPNAANSDKKTALFIAAAHDRHSIVKVLLERGADPNWKDSNDNRPLHFCQSPEVLVLLVGSGAKVNVSNRQGHTPLHVAFAFQNQAVVELLTKSGASVDALSKAGESCSDCERYYSSKLALPFFEEDVVYQETGGIVFEE